jgi:hypothetical protein
VRGGSGWRQFQRRGGRGWTGSGRRASGGGGEAIGQGDLVGVEGLRWMPARNAGGFRWCKEEERRRRAEERGLRWPYSSTLLQGREEEENWP